MKFAYQISQWIYIAHLEFPFTKVIHKLIFKSFIPKSLDLPMKISLYSIVWKLPLKINSLLRFLFLITVSIKTNLCNCKWKELISITSWNLKLPIRLERFIFTQILSLFRRPILVHFQARLILWPFITSSMKKYVRHYDDCTILIKRVSGLSFTRIEIRPLHSHEL